MQGPSILSHPEWLRPMRVSCRLAHSPPGTCHEGIIVG
jgi:hypothetical protein